MDMFQVMFDRVTKDLTLSLVGEFMVASCLSSPCCE